MYNHYMAQIIVDPKVLAGKPVIKGTRIPVELVLKKLATNPNLKNLFAAYPRLTPEGVKACLEYAHAAVSNEVVHPLNYQAINPVPGNNLI